MGIWQDNTNRDQQAKLLHGGGKTENTKGEEKTIIQVCRQQQPTQAQDKFPETTLEHANFNLIAAD